MFEKMLKSAFDTGSEVFVHMNGFNNPLRGRVQDIDDLHFTLFQNNSKPGAILWAFRLQDIHSCGLLVGLPLEADPAVVGSVADASENVHYKESTDN